MGLRLVAGSVGEPLMGGKNPATDLQVTLLWRVCKQGLTIILEALSHRTPLLFSRAEFG